MKKIFLIVLTIVAIGLISVPNVGQWTIWDDIREIPARITEWVDNGNLAADSLYASGNVKVDGSVEAGSFIGIEADKFEDADGDTYGIAVEDSIKFYIKDALAMYIDSLYITLVKDLQAQFPIEFDFQGTLANFVDDSASDGDTLTFNIATANDNGAIQVVAIASGPGTVYADSIALKIANGVLVRTTETVTCASDAGTAAVTCWATFTTTENNSTADVLTLADGNFIGQEKYIELTTDGGDDLEITPTSFANGAKVTLDTAGESATFTWNGTNWTLKCHYNGVVS